MVLIEVLPIIIRNAQLKVISIMGLKWKGKGGEPQIRLVIKSKLTKGKIKRELKNAQIPTAIV